jgi:hypothetical protein
MAIIILAVLLTLSPAAFARAQASSQPAQIQPQPDSLKITDVLFEDYNGDTSSRWQMKPGEDLVVSFRVEGFGKQDVESEDGTTVHHVKLRCAIALKDSAGKAVVPPHEEDVDTTLTSRDEKWRPKINWSVAVPASALAGEYKLDISVSDGIAKRETSRTVPFRISGAALAEAASIDVQQLQYSISESGPWSPQRYFAPADTVWVQYKLVGYAVSPENQVWVEQDWQVLDPEGKTVIQQPNALVENSNNFYPPRFLAATFSLKLDKPKPGQYILRIDIRDRISEQTASFESPFFIRE